MISGIGSTVINWRTLQQIIFQLWCWCCHQNASGLNFHYCFEQRRSVWDHFRLQNLRLVSHKHLQNTTNNSLLWDIFIRHLLCFIKSNPSLIISTIEFVLNGASLKHLNYSQYSAKPDDQYRGRRRARKKVFKCILFRGLFSRWQFGSQAGFTKK